MHLIPLTRVTLQVLAFFLIIEIYTHSSAGAGRDSKGLFCRYCKSCELNPDAAVSEIGRTCVLLPTLKQEGNKKLSIKKSNYQ